MPEESALYRAVVHHGIPSIRTSPAPLHSYLVTSLTILSVEQPYPEQLVPAHRLAEELVLTGGRPASPGQQALDRAAQALLQRQRSLQVVLQRQGHGLVQLLLST